jgi:hypothetical protein
MIAFRFPRDRAVECAVAQYAAGSGESVGFSNACFSAGLMGMLRLTFFGGMACVNHLA